MSSLYSPVGWFSWSDAAAMFEQAKEHLELMKSFVNTVLGEPFEEEHEAPDWERLYARWKTYVQGVVPKRGLFLTAGVDVQKDRLECEVVAWGRDKQSWSVDYIVLDGDTARRDTCGKNSKMSCAATGCAATPLHTIWAWEHGSRMGQDLRYTHDDIFETFPFPIGVLDGGNETLSELGELFFNLRSRYMQVNDKGMTKFYNDFHDPENTTDEIKELRDLQVRINEAVLKAYEMDATNLCHGFHEVAYLPEAKNTRFTVSEVAREALLQSLSMVNKKRYEEEVAQGLHDKKKKTSTARKKKTSPAKDDGNMDLFNFMNASSKGSK